MFGKGNQNNGSTKYCCVKKRSMAHPAVFSQLTSMTDGQMY